MEKNKNLGVGRFILILESFDSIPLIKDGKKGVAQLNGFHDDMQVVKKFKRRVEDAKASELRELRKEWQRFLSFREQDNWCAHSDSPIKRYYEQVFAYQA